MKKLTIEDTCLITGRGLVAAGWEDEHNASARTGDEVEIVRPDTTKIRTQIIGIEMICRKDVSIIDKRPVGLLLKGISEKDISPRSESTCLKNKNGR